jgi:hypothetical protein
LPQQEANKSEQQLGVATLELAKTSKVADGILKKVRGLIEHHQLQRIFSQSLKER